MNINFKCFSYTLLFASMMAIVSCKHKEESSKTQDTTTTVMPAPPAPVVISSDEELNKGLVDATKDYPGVTATVSNGEVTLTGTIKRDRLAGLMQAVNALQPKKVNNNLTIQD